MQHNPRLQPLTLHHVTRGQQEGAETWSTDSDSGITVDSHSPPSRAVHTPHTHPPPPPLKTTPDSGVGLEDPLSWDFPPPPPPSSLLSDNHPPMASAITMTSAVAPRGVASGAPIAGLGSRDEDERRRQQQDYVRNTLLEYERQKRLQEQQQMRSSSNSSSQEDALYDHNDLMEALDSDANVEKQYSSSDRDACSQRHLVNPLTTGGQRPQVREGSYASNRTAHTDRTAHRTHDSYSGRSKEDPNDFYSANSAKDKLSKFYGSKEDRDFKNKNVNGGSSSTVYRSTSSHSRGGYNKPLPPPPPPREGRAEDRGLHGLVGSSHRAIPNDYVPSRLVDKLRHSDDVINDRDVDDSGLHQGDGYRSQRQYGEDLQQCRDELSRKLAGGKREGENRDEEGGGMRESGADDGYGTADSRSVTTATSSLASPLSSSLSSITTDSSSSINGSQRLPTSTGCGNSTGSTGSARAQPVPSGGRLVIGRRAMLVKRRDLPPVEIRSEYGATLEERLRALTTIEEEDPNNPSSASALHNPNKSPPLPPRKDERLDPARNLPRDAQSRPTSGSGSRSGQGDEGPYCSINKAQSARPTSAPILRRPLPGGAGSGHGGSALDQAHSDGDPCPGSRNPATDRERAGSTGSVHSVHRAVPVRVEPEGAAFLPARQDSGGDRYDDGTPRPADSEKTEVRFKAGGAGVKLTDAGQFEIDYSYYMKATPSESNDEVNTYSPDQSKAYIDVEVFHEGVEGGGGANVHSPPSRWDQRIIGGAGYQAPPSGRGSQGDGYYSGRTTPSSGSRVNMEYGAEQDQVYRSDRHAITRSGGVESSLRQGGVMSSMPNLSLHPPPRRHSGDSDYYRQPPGRRHSGDADYQGPGREVDDVQGGLGQPPPYRRNPTPGSGYLGARRTGQGERNSCDVGSLYRQTDLSQTFPPAQGVANDRLSLNLGDLPRIHEQLRATSEMLLSTGKRHQFASSSDIYRLFQGQQQQRQQALGFAQGRQPTHRHSFHNFNSAPQPMQNLSDVRSRVRAGSGVIEQSQGATSPTAGLLVPGPVRADHNIVVPESGGYSQYGGRDSRQMYSREANAAPRDLNLLPRDVSVSPRDASVLPRDVSVSPRDMNPYTKHSGLSPRSAAQPPARDMQGGRTTPSFRERLSRGEQYATDVIQDQDGEKLSTLV